MSRVDYLIIADTNDFTSDYVSFELNNRNKQYLRINRDNFSEYEIEWDILKNKLNIVIDDNSYEIDSSLKGVYYRAPVDIRNYTNSSYEEQLYKTQWMAFVKNLICFENAIWINNPVKTYRAENKMLQLRYADEIGFLVPKTVVTNCKSTLVRDCQRYAVKSIDTLLIRNGVEEGFLYTNIITGDEINKSELKQAPIVVQELINPKIDLRITIIGNTVYPVKIIKDGIGVEDDWRKEKDDVKFIPITISKELEDKCIALVNKFGLKYGAIDMALRNDEYYFIEINPTGEWAWLVESSGLNIYKDIVNVLIGD
ncbi:MAG: ATP-grasp domain-containing protein [Clostridium sp.]